MVAAQKPVDLPADLIFRTGTAASRQVIQRLPRFQGGSPLVDHALVFFLQLHKHAVTIGRNAIAAHPQLFLIDGFIQRGPNQLEIRGIVIEVTNGIASVLVRLHVRGQSGPDLLILFEIQQIFLFISLKTALNVLRHEKRLLPCVLCLYHAGPS